MPSRVIAIINVRILLCCSPAIRQEKRTRNCIVPWKRNWGLRKWFHDYMCRSVLFLSFGSLFHSPGELFLACSFIAHVSQLIPCVYLPILNVWHVKWNFDRFDWNQSSVHLSSGSVSRCVCACAHVCVSVSVHLLWHHIYVNWGPDSVYQHFSSHRNTSHLISAHCRANDYELREGESLANWARCYAFNLINAFDTFFHRSKSLIKWNQRHGCIIIDGPENICARHRIRPQQRSETIWMIKLNRLMFRSFPCVTRIYIASSQCHWKSVEWKSKMSVQWAKMSPIDFGQKSNQPKQSTWVGKKSERRVYWEII